MTIERTEVLWLASRTDYTVAEIGEMSGLSPAVLDALVECGALPSGTSTGASHRFEADAIALARAARRLSEHFELEGNGLAVAVSLLRRVMVLEATVVELRGRTAQVPADPR